MAQAHKPVIQKLIHLFVRDSIYIAHKSIDCPHVFYCARTLHVLPGYRTIERKIFFALLISLVSSHYEVGVRGGGDSLEIGINTQLSCLAA